MNKLSDQWQTPKWLFEELNKEFNFDIDLCATSENSKCKIWYKDYLSDITCSKMSTEQISIHDMNLIDYEVKTAFMNPPYSNPKPFIEKAWEDSKHCKIVCLVKCDPSTRWWATFWDYDTKCLVCEGTGKQKLHETYCFRCNGLGMYNGPKPGCSWPRFLPKRVQFDPPQQLIDNSEVWKYKEKWLKKCYACLGEGTVGWEGRIGRHPCMKCETKGYKPLSGPTFPSAIVIMDRREL